MGAGGVADCVVGVEVGGASGGAGVVVEVVSGLAGETKVGEEGVADAGEAGGGAGEAGGGDLLAEPT